MTFGICPPGSNRAAVKGVANQEAKGAMPIPGVLTRDEYHRKVAPWRDADELVRKDAPPMPGRYILSHNHCKAAAGEEERSTQNSILS